MKGNMFEAQSGGKMRRPSQTKKRVAQYNGARCLASILESSLTSGEAVWSASKWRKLMKFSVGNRSDRKLL